MNEHKTKRYLLYSVTLSPLIKDKADNGDMMLLGVDGIKKSLTIIYRLFYS